MAAISHHLTPNELSLDFDILPLSLDSVLDLARRLLLSISGHLDIPSLVPFLARVEAIYSSECPYHNFYHGVSVLQAGVSLLHALEKDGAKFTDEERFAFGVACLCHDLGHDGRNNTFHIMVSSERFCRFGIDSPQEYFHFSCLEDILSYSDSDIFARMEKRQEIMAWIKRWILATDPFLGYATTRNLLRTILSNTASLDFSDASHRILALELLIHASDLSGLLRPTHILRAWADRVQEELLAQWDEEDRLQLYKGFAHDRKDMTALELAKAHRSFNDDVMVKAMGEVVEGIPQLKDVIWPRVERAVTYWNDQVELEQQRVEQHGARND